MAGRRGETRKRITERRTSPKKCPCAFTADGDAKHCPRGTMVLRGIFLRSGTNSRGAYAPPVRVFSSSPTKKPPERRDGGRKGDDQGLRLRRKTLRCARVRTAGALTPRRLASSVLRQQKKPPERQDGGRRGDDQGLRLRRKTRFASTNSRGAYAPPVRVFSSSPTKKTA